MRICLGRKSKLNRSISAGSNIQVLELETVHSGALLEHHHAVFLGAAPNSGVTGHGNQCFCAGKPQNGSDVSELSGCDACLFTVLR